MKWLAFLLSLTLTISAFGAIKDDVKTLGDLAMGSDSYTAKGRTPEALMKNWFKTEWGDSFKLVFKEIGQMTYGDETEQGLTSVESAVAMMAFPEGILLEAIHESEGEERKELRKRLNELRKNWAPHIRKLHQQGAVFGYTGFGPGYCGVTFVELIILDVKEQKLYRVYLSESGSC